MKTVGGALQKRKVSCDFCVSRIPLKSEKQANSKLEMLSDQETKIGRIKVLNGGALEQRFFGVGRRWEVATFTFRKYLFSYQSEWRVQ